MQWSLTALACVVAAVGAPTLAAAGGTQPTAKPPKIVVPYLSQGAGVYVDRTTGLPVPRPRGAPSAPTKRGLHYAPRNT